MGDRKELEVHKGETGWVDLWYPDISRGEAEKTKVYVGLVHVRAANNISIYFDGGRNGYVISMERTKDCEDHSEDLEITDEMAFIPAWNEPE